MTGVEIQGRDEGISLVRKEGLSILLKRRNEVGMVLDGKAES